MKKIDLVLGFLVGEGIGLLFLWILKKGQVSMPSIPIYLLDFIAVFALPLLAILGIYVAFLIGKKFLFVYQLAKFALIGAFFALVDLTVLNFLMEFLGITRENLLKYNLFFTISFLVATILKYFGDKFWAFEKPESEKAEVEFTLFFVVTLISLGIQLGTSNLILKILPVSNPFLAGNFAKIAGIVLASMWNFLGYKFFVFKK
jgi:putative flippase GtrA